MGHPRYADSAEGVPCGETRATASTKAREGDSVASHLSRAKGRASKVGHPAAFTNQAARSNLGRRRGLGLVKAEEFRRARFAEVARQQLRLGGAEVHHEQAVE